MSSCIPNFFLLSSSGEVLIDKQWLGIEKRAVCDIFLEEAGKFSPRTEAPPALQTPKHVFVSVQKFGLIFLSCLSVESQPLFVLEFLHLILDVFIEYFASATGALTESAVRENFSSIYQLLDEMVDGGFGYTTELNQLKDMMQPPSLARKILQNVTGDSNMSNFLPQHAISKIPWRKSDVKYVTNEIYFDLLESIDCILGANQQTIHATVYGEMRANCRLSGMPDLTLSFTKPNLLDDVSLHRCVRINRFQREKILSFVPPDGQFKLFSYKIGGNFHIPLYVKPSVQFKRGSARVEIQCGSKLTGANEKPITNVVIFLPLPSGFKSHSITANVGTIKLEGISANSSTPSESQGGAQAVLRWDIGRIPKEITPSLEGGLTLAEDRAPSEAPTIRAEFQVKMLSASGLKVDGLAIRGVNYKPFKGVRSITQAGRFQIRCVE